MCSADWKMLFSLWNCSHIFVSWLVLNLLTGAGAYIKHERDLYAFSSVYQIYCTAVTFEVWLQREIIVGIYMQYMEPVLFLRI